jgi:hypothetical protein
MEENSVRYYKVILIDDYKQHYGKINLDMTIDQLKVIIITYHGVFSGCCYDYSWSHLHF